MAYAITSGPFKYTMIGNQMCVYTAPPPDVSAVVYGYLYNRTAAQDSSLASDGWYIATSTDYTTNLTTYLINNYIDITSDNVAIYLKSCRTVSYPLGGECSTSTHPRWNYDASWYGLDSFNFYALPAGYRSHSTGGFLKIGEWVRYWPSVGNFNVMYHDLGTFIQTSWNAKEGGSVKAIRDATIEEQALSDGYILVDEYTGNDGKLYDAVKIGTKIWTILSLSETKWNGGADIPLLLSNSEWMNATGAGYCYFNI